MNFKTYYNSNNILLEGGKAFLDVSPIEQENIIPTLKQYEKEILKPVFNLTLKDIEILGSALKKSTPSGDVDLAIETTKDFTKIKLPIPSKLQKGLGQMYTKFPQFDRSGKMISDLFVQIDLMFGNKEYLKFSYHSPTEQESKYKANYRSFLLFNIARNIKENVVKDETEKITSQTRYGFDIINGLVKYDEVLKKTRFDKVAKKIITKNPDKIAKILLGPTFTSKDLMSAETLITAVKSPKFIHGDLRSVIFNDYKETLRKENLPIPQELE